MYISLNNGSFLEKATAHDLKRDIYNQASDSNVVVVTVVRYHCFN